MKLEDLTCISNNVNLEDYLSLYTYVRDNIEHPDKPTSKNQMYYKM